MIVQEILTHQSNDTTDLDRTLVELCDLILSAQRQNPDHYGLVAACVVDNQGNRVTGINHVVDSGQRIHAERDAVRNYEQTHGKLPDGCLMITTLSPCTEHTGEMAQERAGISCSELMDELNIHRVYCGYLDPTQDIHTQHNNFDCVETQNEKIQQVCREIADCFLEESGYSDPANYRGESVDEAGKFTTLQQLKDYFKKIGKTEAQAAAAWQRGYRGPDVKPKPVAPYNPDQHNAYWWNDNDLDENFADGKKKGRSRPGRVKRAGASCKGSVTDLRARAKKASGERKSMYHWCANMKSGKKK